MKVNFFDLKRQYEKIKDEVDKKVIEVLDSTSYIGGEEVKKLEEGLSKYLNVKHVISVANGTEALVIALKALGIKANDEVITTPFSFFATAEAIATVGAIPVFVDIEEDTFNIDPSKIENAITSKTKAILPVHIFGKCANMDEINRIAKEHNLYVIEDACQAIGAEYKGIKAGTLGDLGCFSFYPTKNLGAYGDAGVITTNSDDLAIICLALKTHGAGKVGAEARNILYHDNETISNVGEATDLYDPYKYYNYLIGHNSRLDTIQAAILNIKLQYIDTYNANRTKIANRYIEAFKDKIECPVVNNNYQDCWHQFVIKVADKDNLSKYLTETGIGNGNFYPVPLHLQKAFSYLNYEVGSLPIAEKVCKQTVCLPIFPELTDEEQTYIIDKVLEYSKEV